jgi:hypothetical protein
MKLPLALTSPSIVTSLVGVDVNIPNASALSSRNIACVLALVSTLKSTALPNSFTIVPPARVNSWFPPTKV